MVKVGLGQDSHKLGGSSEGKPLVLGGVEIDAEVRVVGANSDGDVVLHAICNAISTGLGEGSFSKIADEMNKEGVVDSKEYVKAFVELSKKRRFRVNNVSMMIEAGKPELEKYVVEMKSSIARLVEVSEGEVGIAVTSGEGLTSFGRGEGIQVIALVSLVKYEED